MGRLSRLLVDEGDVVKENQVLAEIESADAHAQLSQLHADILASQAKIERARADVADAELKLSREDELLKRGAGTQATFDDAKVRVAAVRAQLRAAEADERATSARQAATAVALENTKVRAPFAGTIVRKLSEVGEVLSPNSSAATGLFLIASLDDLEVQADVAEAQYVKVRVGTPAEIILDAFPDRRFRGRVNEIRQTVDRAKAAVTVKVGFVDDTKGVLPDMAAKVSFLSKALDQAALKAAPKLTAPADALADRGGRKVLLTIDDGHVRELAVTTGPLIGNQVELTSGPVTGTKIIRHPTEKLREGSAVKEKK
jgi:RND family efflux transporter MFP subunit